MFMSNFEHYFDHFDHFDHRFNRGWSEWLTFPLLLERIRELVKLWVRVKRFLTIQTTDSYLALASYHSARNSPKTQIDHFDHLAQAWVKK